MKFEPLPWWVHAGCVAVGAAAGMIIFLWSATLWAGGTVGKSLMSVHGVLVKDELDTLSSKESELVVSLLNKGALIDANSFLSTLNSFYSTSIQLLIGLFVVFGIFSFVAIRMHSSREIETQTDLVMNSTFVNYLGSIKFAETVSSEVRTNLQLEFEGYLESFSASDAAELNERMNKIESDLNNIEQAISHNSDPEDE